MSKGKEAMKAWEEGREIYRAMDKIGQMIGLTKKW